jgi:hypothetical protein
MQVLERASHVAVIAAALFVLGTTMYDRVSVPAKRVDPALQLVQKYKEKAPPLPGAIQTGKSATVVLFISQHCPFCAQSMPFYERLSRLRAASSNDFALLAYVPEGEKPTSGVAYLGRRGVTTDSVGAASFPDIGVKGTPTVLLLDATGRVRAAWVGALMPKEEKDVLSRIRQLCGKCASV